MEKMDFHVDSDGVISYWDTYNYLSAERRLLLEATLSYVVTEQDLAILKLVSEGLTSKEIGKRLGLTTGTVGVYRSRLGKALGSRGPAGMVYEARNHGLLPLA